MDYFLILILAIVVIGIWQSGKDATARLRDEVADLSRTIDHLRTMIATLQPSQPAAAEPVAPIKVEVPAPPPPTPAEPEKAAAAYQPAPAIAAFTPAQEAPHSLPAEPPRIAPPAPPLAREPVPALPMKAPALSVTANEMEEETPRNLFSFEETLGGNWLNKLGIGILVLGVASFLAFKLQTWGPAGEVLCGYAVSLALLAAGVWLERKPTYRIFARGGLGGGWALAFFTTFALHHIPAARVLNSLAADLILMLIVAACMVTHSLRYRSQTVTGLAFLLGFATLLTSHLEASNDTLVFSLAASAVLALGLVAVTTARHWAKLELVGLAAVYLTHWVWLARVLPAKPTVFAEFWPSTILILLYWLIFRMAYVFRTPLDAQEENLSSLTAVLNSTGVLGLLKLQSAHPEWAFWALAALGAVEMALAFHVRARRRQAFVVLSTIAAVLLVAAVPFKFHGVSWPMLWLVEAQVLAVCGLRLGEPVFRRLGLLAGILTGAVLAVHDVLPLILLRLTSPDFGSHASLTAALALAAALYWVHAEIYPRRWPQIAADENEAFALRATSWLGWLAAVTALWVALPDAWLPAGWLALALALGLAGRRFSAALPVFEAGALGLLAAVVLVFHHVLPLAAFRLDFPDPAPHRALSALLALAALAYWTAGEVYPRLLKRFGGEAFTLQLEIWEAVSAPLHSWLGTAAAAASLWVVLPAPWVPVGWLALMLAVGGAADLVGEVQLALQADALAIAAVCGFFSWIFWTGGGRWDHQAPMLATVALLYAGMRRKTPGSGELAYIPAAYSWTASALLVFAAYDLSPRLGLGPIWLGLGLALFETGRFFRRGFLRWQGLLAAALAFIVYFFFDLPSLVWIEGPVNLFLWTKSLLLEVLLLTAAGFWLLERTRDGERCTRPEQVVATLGQALGTLSLAVWFAYRFPSDWIPVAGGECWVTSIWAALALLMLALAWAMRRKIFLAQAVALALAAVLRGVFLDLFTESPTGFWNDPLTRLSLCALLLLAGLFFAFRLRRGEHWTDAVRLPDPIDNALSRPEQWFFFAPFASMAIALAARLSSGHITIAWSVLGLLVFLFALLVGERSYRLAGLGLLLVAVAKILLMDVWSLPLADRYPTLIVLGLALVAVSFLYTRFGAVIRKFL